MGILSKNKVLKMGVYPKILMLLGSGELGKEVAIAAKRMGCKIIACDRYANAPAMQVADYAEVLNMNNSEELQGIIRKYKPDAVIPEIEALAVDALKELEDEGIKIIPTARATKITMNRDKIRDLASKELNLNTAKYVYASSKDELKKVASEIGYPLLIKPVMSSSGKGQSLVKEAKKLGIAWDKAIAESRGNSNKIIVEEFIDFDLEITLLTIRQKDGSTIFCPPIGHEQINGDYQCSWQPADLKMEQLNAAKQIAKCITENLGGVGLFGVEFFITKDKVVFSELSPRPHDTGLVTIASQNLNEFELHLRAVLGLPIPQISIKSPSASRVILAEADSNQVAYSGMNEALKEEGTNILIFGKRSSKKNRRMGVALANGKSIEEARRKADKSASFVKVI